MEESGAVLLPQQGFLLLVLPGPAQRVMPLLRIKKALHIPFLGTQQILGFPQGERGFTPHPC